MSFTICLLGIWVPSATVTCTSVASYVWNCNLWTAAALINVLELPESTNNKISWLLIKPWSLIVFLPWMPSCADQDRDKTSSSLELSRCSCSSVLVSSMLMASSTSSMMCRGIWSGHLRPRPHLPPHFIHNPWALRCDLNAVSLSSHLPLLGVPGVDTVVTSVGATPRTPAEPAVEGLELNLTTSRDGLVWYLLVEASKMSWDF